jgi:hypothetical protein
MLNLLICLAPCINIFDFFLARKFYFSVGVEVITEVALKSGPTIVWDVKPYRLVVYPTTQRRILKETTPLNFISLFLVL